jgi:hypothetical protein
MEIVKVPKLVFNKESLSSELVLDWMDTHWVLRHYLSILEQG